MTTSWAMSENQIAKIISVMRKLILFYIYLNLIIFILITFSIDPLSYQKMMIKTYNERSVTIYGAPIYSTTVYSIPKMS